MDDERLITGIAAVFAAIAVVLTVVAVARAIVILPVAVAFAVAAYFMYDQLSGRMAGRVYRRVEERARADDTPGQPRGGARGSRGQSGSGFGPAEAARRARPGSSPASQTGRTGAERNRTAAGPREDWEPPRGGQTAREAAAGGRRAGRTRQRTANRQTAPGPSPADRAAYETLGVDPGADEETIRAAYRDLVKEAHPDAPEGSQERFKAIKEAYEHLVE